MNLKIKYSISFFVLFLFVGLSAQEPVKDSVVQVVRSWKINAFGDTTEVNVDTGTIMYHLYNPLYQKSISNTYLGYVGSAGYSNNFFEREPFDHFLFNTYYYPYMRKVENLMFFNTRRPFTKIEYVTNSNKPMREEVMHFSHTQNITKDWNFGFNLDIYSTNGQFMAQKSSNQLLSFFSSLNKQHYHYYFTLCYNSMKRNENAGLKSDSVLSASTTGSLGTAVNLADGVAKSKNSLLSSSLHQGYHFYSLFQRMRNDTSSAANSINLSSRYELSRRYYTDNDQSFYKPSDYLFVKDSTVYHHINNELQLLLGNFFYVFKLGISAIYEINSMQYYRTMGVPSDTISNYMSRSFDNALFCVSLTSARQSQFEWNFTGKNYVYGYQSGDFSYKANGRLKLKNSGSFLYVAASDENLSPAYGLIFMRTVRTNWDNTFAKENKLQIRGGYESVKHKFKAGMNYAVVSNLLYFDPDGKPVQSSVPVSIMALSAEKHLTLGKWSSVTKGLYQVTDNSRVVRIPTFSVFETIYFAHTFKFSTTRGKLYFMAGADIYFNTAFYADAYDYKTGLFYHQDNREIGNYPFIDAFVTIKIKRSSIFLRWDHVAHPYLGYDYYTAYHYAIGDRAFKFGIRWTFYD